MSGLTRVGRCLSRPRTHLQSHNLTGNKTRRQCNGHRWLPLALSEGWMCLGKVSSLWSRCHQIHHRPRIPGGARLGCKHTGEAAVSELQGLPPGRTPSLCPSPRLRCSERVFAVPGRSVGSHGSSSWPGSPPLPLASRPGRR